MGIREEDIESYYNMVSKKEYYYKDIEVVLNYGLYVNFSYKDLEEIKNQLNKFPKHISFHRKTYIEHPVRRGGYRESYRNRKENVGYYMGYDSDGRYRAQKGKFIELTNVKEEKIYEFYKYYVRVTVNSKLKEYKREVKEYRELKLEEKDFVELKIFYIQETYFVMMCVYGLLINYFCGYEKAREFRENYTEEYFKLLDVRGYKNNGRGKEESYKKAKVTEFKDKLILQVQEEQGRCIWLTVNKKGGRGNYNGYTKRGYR